MEAEVDDMPRDETLSPILTDGQWARLTALGTPPEVAAGDGVERGRFGASRAGRMTRTGGGRMTDYDTGSERAVGR